MDPAGLLAQRGAPLVAPSLLSADFALLAQEVERAERAGADILHLDVMDGHFVPNLTFGPLLVKALRPRSVTPFDVHLMIENPAKFVPAFCDAGADLVSFHVEAVPEAREASRIIAMIRQRGARAGISLRPATPVERVTPFLEEIDLLLVMSVDPGFGGQPFIPASLARLRFFRDQRDGMGASFVIEVDGGINAETAAGAIHEGAEILVAGSALFGPGDMQARIRGLKQAGRPTPGP